MLLTYSNNTKEFTWDNEYNMNQSNRYQKERHKKSELPENLHDSVGQTSPKAIFIPKTNTLQETVTLNAEVSAEGEKVKSGYTTPPRKKGNISGKT